jgi:plasmid stabilization system protein ParE
LRVIWTLGAQEDARELVLLTHSYSPKAARKLAEEFALSAERLADFPQLGMEADDAGHRYLLVARGRFRMIYRIDPDGLRILGLSRAARPWPGE